MDTKSIFERIKNSSGINDSNIRELLPEPNNTSNYYFVSYSHLDYKKVLIDIISFQERNINIWYDRGLEAGKSWIDDVNKKIESFYCKGAIIYLSKNYRESKSCEKEYLKLQELNKDIIFILLDNFFDDLIDPEMQNVLRYDDDLDSKVQYIESMQGEDLLQFELEKMNFLGQRAFLSGVNDKNITKLDVPQKWGKYKVIGIKDGALSNCINLEEITLPKGFLICQKEAFKNCYSLKRININPPFKYFGFLRLITFDRCFSGCLSLNSLDNFQFVNGKKHSITFKSSFLMNNPGMKEITIDKNTCFEGYAIRGLENLNRIVFNEIVALKSLQSFQSNSLTEIEFTNQCKNQYLPNYMFYGCRNLRRVCFNEKIKSVGESTFEDNISLEEIDFPESLAYIGYKAFMNCNKLESIHFKKNTKLIFSNAFDKCQSLNEIKISSKKMLIVNAEDYKKTSDISTAFPNIKKLYLIKDSKLIAPPFLKEVDSDDSNYRLYVRGDNNE